MHTARSQHQKDKREHLRESMLVHRDGIGWRMVMQRELGDDGDDAEVQQSQWT